MSKQNLDKLFQEKLKNFEETPDEQVWTSIEASLDKKKKSRRVIPIWWWRLGGVAAVLAVLLYVTNPFGSEMDDTSISNVEKQTDSLKNGKNDAPPAQELFKTTTEDNTGITVAEEDDLKNKKEPVPVLTTDVQRKGTGTSKNLNESKRTLITPKNISSNRNQITQTTTSEKSIKKETIDKRDLLDVTPDIEEKEAVAQISISKDKDSNVQEDKTSGKDTKDPKERTKEALLKNPVLTELDPKEAVAQNDPSEKEEIIEDPKKKSIFDEINKEGEEEEDAIAKSSKGKWSVGPSVAPVFFDSFGEGSPIHSNFSSNSKSGNLNLSYGVAVSYDISKKLSVRTGIHKVDYGYDTNDIAFSSSLDGSTNSLINNINYTVTSRNLVVQSKASTTPQASVGDLTAKSAALDGRMVQEFGYLEVPLELNYALLDKKLGVHIIGGVSSLFLINNIVTLESEGLSTDVGEANNINDVNFSTNIGFGINYKFTPKVQLSLEPVFKYQLNTFSDTAGSFNPFSIGVYSGVNFKF